MTIHHGYDRRRAIRWAGVSLVILAGSGVALLALTLTPAPQEKAGVVGQPSPEIAARWGIDHLRLVRSAGGHLLDFRYRIVDPAKAAPLQARGVRPYVLHPRTGARLSVPTTPKAGALRNTGKPQRGRVYFALFSNPKGLVQRGDRVSVVFDSFTAPDVLVE